MTVTMPPGRWSTGNSSRDGPACFPEADGSCLCPTLATRLVLPILYTFMLLTGLPGNVLSLWIFTKMISTRTSTHFYLISLGASNLLLCLTMPFQAAYSAVGTSWQAGHPACRLVIGLVTPVLHVNICVGMFTLTWVALSRCALLLQQDYGEKPSTCTRLFPPAFFRRLRQASFAKASCVATWTLVVSCVFPMVIYYAIHETVAVDSDRRERCYGVTVEVGGDVSRESSIGPIVFFYICFLLVLASYSAVSRYFIRYRRTSAIGAKHRISARVLRNIVVIQFVLTVCLLPYHIFKAIFIEQVRNTGLHANAGCHPLSQLVEVKNFLLCLAASRCCTDPVMYLLLDKTFHKHVMSILNVRVCSQAAPRVAQSCGSTEGRSTRQESEGV